MTVTAIDSRSKHETAPQSEAKERLQEEANPREVAALAKAMDPDMLRCRRLRGHAWDPSTASRVRGGFIETLVCQRCGAEKDRSYNSRGRITEYGPVRYPEGYLFKGIGRVGMEGRDVINLASLNADIVTVKVTAGSTKRRRK